jgi:hypothetical protein
MLESSKGPDKTVWKSRIGRAVLLTIVVMIVNYNWWTGRNLIREMLVVVLAFALSLGVVSLFDFARRWLGPRHRP